MLGLLRQKLCVCFKMTLQSSGLKSFFDSQEFHGGIARPPKACRLTMGP